jgi:hypothetical protein
MISLRTSRYRARDHRSATGRLAGRAVVLSLLSVAALGTGCAPTVHLRNPETGQRAACEGGFRAQGLAGIMDQSAKRLQTQCVNDYQSLGYVRAE